MKIRNIIGLLVVFATMSFAQGDYSVSKAIKSDSSKNLVVVAESSKTLKKTVGIILPNNSKTTWTKIKDLFM